MSWSILTYSMYLIGSAFFTIWVGHTLYRSGAPYVQMAFTKVAIATSVNRLLLIGFYLVNTAYILLVLKEKKDVDSLETMLELLSVKLGLIVGILALMHFLNLLSLFIIKKYKTILS